jgi:hypothetical protein
VRRDVALVTGGRLEPGDKIAAVDTGNARGIYPADGGSDWLIITVIALAGVVVSILWMRSVWSAPGAGGIACRCGCRRGALR